MDNDTTTRDTFDRAMGQLEGLPGGVTTKQTTVQSITPLVGNAETWIVQTIRWAEGETVFVQRVSADAPLRLVIPPKVAAVIARQHDAVSATLRSRQARRIAAERKAAGIAPGFMKNRGKGGRKAKK